jgi:hypothetical protein
MSGFQKVAVIIAITGLATTLTMPGRQTASILGAGGKAISEWTRASQGR